jgi:cysteine synthase A
MDKPSQTALLTCGAGIALGISATLAAQKLLAGTSSPSADRRRRRSSVLPPALFKSDTAPVEDIRAGLEECIGNTPLILLKSLSAATGCEILGKAEVC